MPNKLMCMFPSHDSRGRHFVYLVGGADGLLKIGMTTSPRERIKTHRRTLGENFAWCHLFPAINRGDAYGVENILKTTFEAVGTRVRKTEMFYGITKHQAIAVGRDAYAKYRRYAEAANRESIRRNVMDQAWEVFKAQHPEMFAKAEA